MEPDASHGVFMLYAGRLGRIDVQECVGDKSTGRASVPTVKSIVALRTPSVCHMDVQRSADDSGEDSSLWILRFAVSCVCLTLYKDFQGYLLKQRN